MLQKQELHQNSDKALYHKALCQLDPVYFIQDILGYDVEPHHKRVLNHITGSKKTLDLAPRGFGKSTIGDIGYCLWKIIQNRNIRILIVSNTQRQAEAFIREVKNQLEGNQKLIELFGSFTQDSLKWTESELTVTGRTSPKKESTLTALGASGALISKHFDVIVADDVLDFESARTPLQRKKLSEWYRTALLPTLEPNGELHVLGTRYNPGDLYQELIDSKQYSVHIQRAIQDNQSLWPAKFTLDDLLHKKSELGSLIFGLQFQNDTVLAKAGHIFRFEWLQFYERPPAGLKIYQGCDLAISEKETADYFVLMTIGLDPDTGIYYVLDMYRDRISFRAQQEVIKLKAEQWQPISIGIESNAYQKSLSQELIRQTSLPIRQITTQRDKVSRAQVRSALFENGKIKIKKDMSILIDEFCLFPDAAHDDIFDAFDLAITASETSLSIDYVRGDGFDMMGGGAINY